MKNGKADIDDEDFSIISEVIIQYINSIFRCLREHGYDQKTMGLYILGGGGKLVKHFYPGALNKIHIIDNICINAKGYEYLADLKLRSTAR